MLFLAINVFACTNKKVCTLLPSNICVLCIERVNSLNIKCIVRLTRCLFILVKFELIINLKTLKYTCTDMFIK